MAEDISRKAVLVLVLVAVIVSLLSTTLVLKTVYRFAPPSQDQEAPSAGRVSLYVPPPQGNVILTVAQVKG